MKIEIELTEKDGKVSITLNGKEPFDIDVTGVSAVRTKAWIVYIKIYNALEAALREALGERLRPAPAPAKPPAKPGKASKLDMSKMKAAPRAVEP